MPVCMSIYAIGSGRVFGKKRLRVGHLGIVIAKFVEHLLCALNSFSVQQLILITI